jgi:glutamyl-tRNA reductase
VLVCLSANHRNASFETLESLSVVASAAARALTDTGRAARGAVVLATCNRFEAYLDVETDPTTAVDAAFRVLAAASSVPESELRESITVLHTEKATSHLFAVTSGLESVVVGEDEISGQVSRALDAAREAGTTTSALEAVFQRASRTSRWVKTSTSLGASGRSMVRHGLDLVAEHLGSWPSAAILVVGTGQYAATTVAALRNRQAADLRVYSPSGRGTVFAAKYRLWLETDLVAAVATADLIITCTGAFVIGTKHFDDARPHVVMDLGMPRNVDPAIADLDGVELFDLERIRLSIQDEHADAAGAARSLVGEAAARHDADVAVEPSVLALRAHIGVLVEAEIARARARGTSTTTSEAALRRLAKAMLHEPSARARGLALDGRVNEVNEALDVLFGIRLPQQVDDGGGPTTA